jgi:hypothetical protein
MLNSFRWAENSLVVFRHHINHRVPLFLPSKLSSAAYIKSSSYCDENTRLHVRAQDLKLEEISIWPECIAGPPRSRGRC